MGKCNFRYSKIKSSNSAVQLVGSTQLLNSENATLCSNYCLSFFNGLCPITWAKNGTLCIRLYWIGSCITISQYGVWPAAVPFDIAFTSLQASQLQPVDWLVYTSTIELSPRPIFDGRAHAHFTVPKSSPLFPVMPRFVFSRSTWHKIAQR